MPRNGLSRARLVSAAAGLIEREGMEQFSMRALAQELDVRPASLYNHAESMQTLLVDVCVYALGMQREAEVCAIRGRDPDAAIRALSHAYRRFAREHRELYRLIMNTAASCGEALGDASRCIIEPFLEVLQTSPLQEAEKLHWQRVLRAMLHGFVSQEDGGFFSHLPACADESFERLIRCYIDGLRQAERRAQA